MEYINETVLNTVLSNKEAFKNNIQFPWMNIKDFIYQDKFNLLFNNFLPDNIFENNESNKLKMITHFNDDKKISEAWDRVSQYKYWDTLVREFSSKEYKDFLNDMFEEKMERLAFEFFIHEQGSYLKPHCDVERKIGSHLFYLLPSDYWDPAWGGQTEILLTDKKESENFKSYKVSRNSFQDKTIKPEIVDNHSFLFKKTDKSWHFVDTVRCPPGKKRIMFQLVALRSK